MVDGHSHLLKIIFDNELDLLHINPGAAGNQGWQRVRTLVRITIDGTEYLLHEGESIVMPAGHPHAVYGQEAFKMLLVVVF